MSSKILVWIILRVVIGYGEIYGTSCTSSCTCDNDKMECNILPQNIPSNIRSVFIKNTNIQHLYNNNNNIEFDESWHNVQKLDIRTGTIYLRNNMMTVFHNLIHLKIHAAEEFEINSYAFNGLDSLVELDLSGNGKLTMKDLLTALNPPYKQVLPKLQTLNTQGIQSAYIFSIIIDVTFFEAITASRDLKYVDMSETNIGLINLISVGRFCATVDTLILRNCTIASVFNFERPTCESLRTLDISGTYFPILRLLLNFETTNFRCAGVTLYFSIENLIIDNLIDQQMSPILEIVNNYHLDLKLCYWNLTHVSFRHNSLRLLNMTVSLSSTMRKTINYIDMSNNILEYISPSVLSSSVNVHHLDMSHNRLHVMQQKHIHEFSIFFVTLVNLKYLNLSNNELTDLPEDIFQGTHNLVDLNLSHNKINAITFNFEHLLKLKSFVIKSNKILYLDTTTLMKLDKFSLDTKNTNKEGVKLDISENNFICKCNTNYREFIIWVQNTDMINRHTDNYACTLSDQSLSINSQTVDALDNYCTLEIVKLSLIIGIPIFLTTFIASQIMRFYMKKRKARRQTLIEYLEQIRGGVFPWKYLAFMSFCSENEDVVKNHIYPQLIEAMQQLTETNSELICIGDRHIRPGFSIRSELVDCILNSAVVIIIVSNVYCEKECCQIEVEESYNLNKPIILIMLEKVDKDKMGKILLNIFHRYTHASWIHENEGGQLEPNATRLVKSMITLAGNNKKFKKSARVVDIELQQS